MAIIIHNVDGGFGKRTRTIIIPTEIETMKATEARKIRDRALVPPMATFHKAIREAASSGADGVSVSVEGLNHYQVPKIIETLRADGYTVKREQHSDCRESWDNLVISWAGPSAKDYYDK